MHKQKIYLFFIMITSLFIISCQKNHITYLHQAQIDALTPNDIWQFNQQICEMEDHNAVLLRSNHPLQKRLNHITESLPKTVNNQTINYKIYVNPEPYAWSTLNGCVRLSSQIINILNDDELKAALIHEIAHIKLQHSLARFNQAKEIEVNTNGEMILVSPATLMVEQELEADNFAMQWLANNHVNVYALLSMLDKLVDYQKVTNSTHPQISARKSNFFNKINKLR